MIEHGTRLSVLVVEDDDTLRATIKRFLSSIGCDVRVAPTISDGREELEREAVDLALVDYQLPDGTGDQLIRFALDTGRARAACCMTARASCRNVVEAMRAGSFDVLEKPFHLERLATIVQAHRPASEADLHAWRLRACPDVIGDDPALCDALTIVRNVADTECSVLIGGESGTGKELIAQALHASSLRAAKPFVALNCSAISETLIEAELFGHVRGAFTGAVGAREGCFMAANGGTLFLDEIGDMPVNVQAKLLRVLQERKVTPVGSDRALSVDVRVVAATHRDLEGMVDEGTFRGDLFFRLNVIRVELPPLRDRTGDIIPLAHFLLDKMNRKARRTCSGFDVDAAKALQRHLWPGNVRELANIIERAVAMRGQGLILEKDLQLPNRSRGPLRPSGSLSIPIVPLAARPLEEAPPLLTSVPAIPLARPADDNLNLREVLNGMERQLILQALERTHGNRVEAAALLGLNRTTLVEKIRKLGG